MQLANQPPHVLKAALKKVYTDSLYATAKHLCGFKDMTGHTHDPIVSVLEDDSKRKMICVPRGTFKSSIGAIAYPIWLLMRNPNLRILIDSEIYGNSVTYLNAIKNIMQSPDFIDIFGDWMPTSDQVKRLGYSWNDSEVYISKRSRILKEPTISCGGIGTTKVGQHFDVIIGDDYNSPANTATLDQRKKVIDHYQFNLSILETDGTYAIIGTRYHEEDLIGFILKNELGFKSLEEFKKQTQINGVYKL
jgi:hypothetical protein